MIAMLAAASLLCGISCTKEFYGSYPYQEPGDLQVYMSGITQVYLVDHLWVMERALAFDERGIYENIRKTEEYDTGGESIWTPGTKWTASEVKSLSGIVIEKTQEDSTWVLRRDTGAKLAGVPSFPTRSAVTLRMLKTPEGAPRHEWQLSVDEFVRTENLGYKAVLETREPAVFRVAGDKVAWGFCKGNFWMTVTKNEEVLDKAVLSYNGTAGSAEFFQGL